MKGDCHMYINDLGIERAGSGAAAGRTSSVDNRRIYNGTRTSGTAGLKRVNSYDSVMRQAVENQKELSNTPTFASAGDIIIQEAFQKMETDPEWEATVMDKVKEYYAGNNAADGTVKGWQYLTGQNGLQSYLMQNLLGMTGTTGLMGYYPAYGFGNQVAAAYGNVMNNAVNSSLFGSWQL